MDGLFPAVILFRHGQTDDNAARRFQGHAATPLNALGRDQARRAGEIISNLFQSLVKSGSLIGECRTSDLCRASETAGIISGIIYERRGEQLSFIKDSCLREFCVGSLQGCTVDEFDVLSPGVLKKFYDDYHLDVYNTKYPGEDGESRQMVAARLAALVEGANAAWVRAANAGCGQGPFATAGDVLEHRCDVTKHAGELLLWSAHGGTIDVILELMQIEGFGHKGAIGNGDVLFLAPVSKMVEGRNNYSEREKFALANNCVLKWKLLRHYQVGDSIAAKALRKPI